MAHWLCHPAVTPEKGEVNQEEASSIASWMAPSLFAEEPFFGADEPGGPLSLISFCWWVDADEVCSMAKIAKETITMRQMIREASRRRVDSPLSTNGQISHRDGRPGGVRLTADGRHARWGGPSHGHVCRRVRAGSLSEGAALGGREPS